MNISSRILVSGNHGASKVIRATSQQQARAGNDDPILVKQDSEGSWSPVETLDSSIGRDEMAASYGLWQDATVEKSGFFTSEVVRAKDGQIQHDEVSTFKDSSKTYKRGRYTHETVSFVGAEIAKGDNFSLLRQTSVSDFGYDNSERVKEIRLNDENWLVNG